MQVALLEVRQSISTSDDVGSNYMASQFNQNNSSNANNQNTKNPMKGTDQFGGQSGNSQVGKNAPKADQADVKGKNWQGNQSNQKTAASNLDEDMDANMDAAGIDSDEDLNTESKDSWSMNQQAGNKNIKNTGSKSPASEEDQNVESTNNQSSASQKYNSNNQPRH